MKKREEVVPSWGRMIKILRIMKLTAVLIVILSIQAFAIRGQNAKYSLSMDKATFVEVIEQLEKMSGYHFMLKYNQEILDKKVDLNYSEATLQEILTDLLRGTGFSYKFIDKYIAITPVGETASEEQQPGRSVTGKVTGAKGEPLPGVTVVVKGTSSGTITNADGSYTISNIPDNAILVFSFVGMKSREVLVGNQTNINMILEEETIGIGEVVAIGYGTVRKSDLTGSLSSIESEKISAFPATTVSQALQGRASGVHVIQNTGRPGAGLQIRIRGTNSIKGDNSPLWIIDGFPGDESMLNLSDIEGIEVLKDASATAIYGSRGANGVILITTKHGKAGATRVDYDGSFTLNTVRKRINLCDAQEYMLLQNIQQLNDVGKEYFTQAEISQAGKGTDWQDEMFRSAPLQDHSLTVSGGNEKVQFSIGTGYFDQKGIFINDDGYKRISLRANVNHDISKKFSVSYNAIFSRTNRDEKYNMSGYIGRLANIVNAPPTLSPYKDDGSYTVFKTAYPFSYDGSTNPVMSGKEQLSQNYQNKAFVNLAFTYKPIEDLFIKISGNAANNDSRSDSYTPTTYTGSSGSASISTSQSLHLNSDNIVTYHKLFNEKHDFTATSAITYEEDIYTYTNISGSGFLSDKYETHNIGAAITINTPSSSYSKWNLLSYLGRLNYSYRGKYYATASFRADGSSRYSEGNKWGYFPSAALAWRVSDENFMDNIGFISNLKIRAGYGETGSTAISPYATLSILSTGKTVFNDNSYTYFAPSSTYPGNLKWETTAQSDIGLDVSFLDNRLSLTADYYIKNTRDLLNSVQLPRSTGYTSTIKNIGEIQNKGIDIQLDAKVLDRAVKWDLTANFSMNRNTVKKLYEGQDITGDTYNVIILSDYINLIREGEEMCVFYGYQEDGYDENGKIKYKDNDGVSGITSADKKIIGNPNPDFIYSLNSVLSYKNFELSWFIQGTQGNDILSLSMTHQGYYGNGLNTLKEVYYDHWTETNTNAKYPKVSKASTSLKLSDRFVYDGSYARLKNIQLAYNIPVGKLGVYWLKRGQIYVSGQNLITLLMHDYPWYDPEVNSAGGGSSINQGIDYFTYPISKGFTFGVKLGF
jgi:TonB-linked SusC/RagA family outer membrane protein